MLSNTTNPTPKLEEITTNTSPKLDDSITNTSPQLAQSTLESDNKFVKEARRCPVCECEICFGDNDETILAKREAKKLVTDEEKAECTRKCYNGGLAASMWASVSD